MLKIGDFSRIAHVSIKALRLYAQEGLLEPIWIDRFSGYRYYSMDQLPLINRILVLKDLGFTLDQIKHLNKGNLSIDELRGMLRIKKTELMLKVQEEQMRLARVENRLAQIETEGLIMDDDVILKPIPAGLCAWAKSKAATLDQFQEAQVGLQQTILQWCEMQKIRAIGPWFSFQGNSNFSEVNFEIQLAVSVENGARMTSPQDHSPVKLRRLPNIHMAACLLGRTTNPAPLPELMHWIEANHYMIDGETRFVYLGETPDTPFSERLVEVQIPVRSYSLKPDLENLETKMDPVKIESLPSFKVMGLKYRGKNENNEIAAMWGELNPIAYKIPMIGTSAYGVCFMISDAPQGVFEYVAGFMVANDAVAPEGMVVVEIPQQKYAIFEHIGSMKTLRDTYNNIIHDWFPRSEYKPIGKFDMEVYDRDKFKNFEPDSILYIYEPVS